MDRKTRLLLPFTGGLDERALNYAIQLADQHRALLVPLVLLPVEFAPGRGVRLEKIQQAQDFLELVLCKAKRYDIAIEPAYISTGDVPGSIEMFASEMQCEAVLLFVNDEKQVLLTPSEIRALLDRKVCTVYVVLLPSKGQKRAVHYSPLPASASMKDDMPGSALADLLLEEMQEKVSFFSGALGHSNL